ncbi:MAG: hypothetical protein HY304_00055 [candidate division Zixibacteria bacterium]|nr:hypothetical protein [candidate division Zixibacteria bacterium]
MTSARAAEADSIPGVQIRIAVFEVLDADPPQTQLIDSLASDVRFGQETTLRAGNFVLYVTATPSQPGSVHLSYGMFTGGAAPDTRFDNASVEFDTPFVVENIHGKGKSNFRALIFAHATDVHPTPGPHPADTTGWNVTASEYYFFYLPAGPLPEFRFLPYRQLLDGEWGKIKDSFNFSAPGRVNYYVVEGSSDDFPFDPRFQFGVDPARNRVAACFDRKARGIDARATIMVGLYRWWGYAPDLLVVGAAGLLTFADYDVKRDREAGHAIPLDSLVRTLDFKRHDARIASHHAASFVRWLLRTRGFAAFHELYDKSTDLSLQRAFWAVYGKTLRELEQEWLGYLKGRTFTAQEIFDYAERARYYGRYDERLALLHQAVSVAGHLVPDYHLALGQAQAQLGLWDSAAATFRQLLDLAPANPTYQWSRAEALWAAGDTLGAVSAYEWSRYLDADDPRPFLRLGDWQYRQRRIDSAASLWWHGLKLAKGPRMANELLLRLGRYERSHRNGSDTARALFAQAWRQAEEMIDNSPGDPEPWMMAGEAMLGLDSTGAALERFQAAAYYAQDPFSAGRIACDIGFCYDRMGRRTDAVQQYESVLASLATDADKHTARYYVNNVYR